MGWWTTLAGCWIGKVWGPSTNWPGRYNRPWDWWRMQGILSCQKAYTVCLACVAKYRSAPQNEVSAPALVNHCCRLRQPKKSVVTEHAFADAAHCVPFEETKILFLKSPYYPWLHLESIQIFNMDLSVAMNRRRESLLLNSCLLYTSSIWSHYKPNISLSKII